MFELPTHLHPMVVHFPIALFITALGFEGMGFIFKNLNFHQTAVSVYVLSALLTPFVYYTGVEEADRVGISHPVLDQHQLYAFWTMWTALASLPVLYLLKKKLTRYYRVVFLILCIIVVGLVSLTADKGGTMVYEYGIGVEE